MHGCRLHDARAGGSVRTRNASVICLKNIGLYGIAGIAYYVVGYNLMYVDVGSFIGSFSFLRSPSPDELALLAGAEGARDAVVGAWTWGDGWLGANGFQDFAGSSVAHATGGAGV